MCLGLFNGLFAQSSSLQEEGCRIVSTDPDSKHIVKDIPNEIEYITVYTQPSRANSYRPYVIRFEDSTTLSILQKQMKGIVRSLKRVPIELIEFDGFELERIGNEQDDLVSQRAAATVKSYGFHDYAKRDNPVYYFKRVR